MAENPTPELLNLIAKAIQSPIANFHIELKENIKGEGFIGDVIFVTLTNKNSSEKHFLAVKQQKTDGGKVSDWSTALFANEAYFYDIVWPKFKELYFERTQKSLDFIPKCLGTSKDVMIRIAMENLKSSGFETYDKRLSFNKEHLLTIFKTYGIFHGISMCLKEQNYEEFCELISNIKLIFERTLTGEDFMSKSITKVFSEIQNLCIFDSTTEKHLMEVTDEYKKNGWKILHKLLTVDSVPRAIIHGDCWSNNMMFKQNVSQIFNHIFLSKISKPSFQATTELFKRK